MNRQIRRAQEKQDKKQEKEKAKKRAGKRARIDRAKSSRRNRAEERVKSNAPQPGKPPTPEERKRMPGRFSGVLTLVTVFFISLQNAGAAVEEAERTVGTSLIAAGFYLMLGYFATLWFMRRGVPRAPIMSVVGSAILTATGAVVSLVQGRELDPLLLALALPAAALGAFLGRLVFVATPRR